MEAISESIPEEKQPLFINDSPYTKEILKKASKNVKIICIFGFVMCPISLLAANLIYYHYDLLVFCAMVYAFLGCVCFFAYRANIKRNTQAAENAHHIFYFYEDEVCAVNFYGEEKRGENRLTYAQFTRVTKMNGLLFLQFGGLAWLVDPACFSLGTEEDLLAFLREKCHSKVVKIKKKNK